MRVKQSKVVSFEGEAFKSLFRARAGLDGAVHTQGEGQYFDRVKIVFVYGENGIWAMFEADAIDEVLADACNCLPEHVGSVRWDANEERVSVGCIREIASPDDASKPWRPQPEPEPLNPMRYRGSGRHAKPEPEALTWPHGDEFTSDVNWLPKGEGGES